MHACKHVYKCAWALGTHVGVGDDEVKEAVDDGHGREARQLHLLHLRLLIVCLFSPRCGWLVGGRRSRSLGRSVTTKDAHNKRTLRLSKACERMAAHRPFTTPSGTPPDISRMASAEMAADWSAPPLP